MSIERLGWALSHRLASLFRLAVPPAIDAGVFSPQAERRLDSMDLVELAVTIEDELGVRLYRDDVETLTTLRELAGLLNARANDAAVARFVDRWAP